MKKEPKVSVIMGIYNCVETLGESIESIINQTFQDFELIMCDDGSTDETYSVAYSYFQKYPTKIVLLKNERNQGLNYTLNKCLYVANGEYIARMDGDDISLPDRFDIEVNFLDNNPKYAFVSSPMIYFDNDGVFKVGVGTGEPDINSFPISTPFCHAPCMIRKNVFDIVEGYTVDKKLLRVEDWHLWIKLYKNGFKGYMLNMPLYMMRDDKAAKSRRKLKYRFNEAYVSRLAVKLLNLPKWMYVYSLRPIIIGLLPKSLYIKIHRR